MRDTGKKYKIRLISAPDFVQENFSIHKIDGFKVRERTVGVDHIENDYKCVIEDIICLKKQIRILNDILDDQESKIQSISHAETERTGAITIEQITTYKGEQDAVKCSMRDCNIF